MLFIVVTARHCLSVEGVVLLIYLHLQDWEVADSLYNDFSIAESGSDDVRKDCSSPCCSAVCSVRCSLATPGVTFINTPGTAYINAQRTQKSTSPTLYLSVDSDTNTVARTPSCMTHSTVHSTATLVW